MKRRMRHVLPTAPSPTRQILTFIRWRSIDILTGGSSRPPALGYKGIAQRLSSRITGRFFAWRSGPRLGIGTVSYRIGERLERFVDAGPGLRGREEGGRVVDRAHPRQLFLADDPTFLEVHLVPEEHDGDISDLLADHLDPVVEIVEGVFARHVAHRDDAMGSLEVRVPQEGSESFLAHDIPHHHVEGRGRSPPAHLNSLLGDLRAHRGDVPVIELFLDETPDQGGLADRDVPDEANLGLHVLLAGHCGRRHHAAPNGRRLMYREGASIAPDNSYSSATIFLAYRSFATRWAKDWNASSTFTPAFADVKRNGLS